MPVTCSVQGAPGVGKSVLSSLVIDELKSKFKDTDTIVVYYVSALALLDFDTIC